jgi:hypothetical protein
VEGAEQVVAGRVALEEVLQVAGDEVIDRNHLYIGWRIYNVQIQRDCDWEFEFGRLRNTLIVGWQSILLLLCDLWAVLRGQYEFSAKSTL